jgi:hypothetical protein
MDVVEQPACANCGAPLIGPFCAGCGQKRTTIDLTFAEFLHETTHELTHWDGKIPQTLKALFLNPGLLTVDLFAGRRARWLSPLRLYLICSIGYFLSGPFVDAMTHRSERELASMTMTHPDGSKTLTPETRQELEATPPALIFGVDRLERAVVNSDRFLREIEAVRPKSMFILVPLFAVFTRALWRRRVPRYPAHLYFALHLHAAWFGILALFTLFAGFVPYTAVSAAIGVAAFIYSIWYGLRAARVVFQDSWLLTIAKACALAVVYSVCLFAVSLVMLGFVLLRM